MADELTVQDSSNKISLSSPEQANEILSKISSGENIELNVDKSELLGNLNTFMIAEAYSQLPTILKLHELQMKCLDKYYEQVNELLDEDDANVFMLDKIITTINNTIDRSNNIIMRLGLNSDITEQLTIQPINNVQNNINVFQSQLSKQRVLNAIDEILKSGQLESNVESNKE